MVFILVKWILLGLIILIAAVLVFLMIRLYQVKAKKKELLINYGKQVSAKLLQYRRISLSQVRVTLQLDVDGKKIGKECMIYGKSDDWCVNLLASGEPFIVIYHPDVLEVRVI